jgi:preprotein translocase subunit YajC
MVTSILVKLAAAAAVSPVMMLQAQAVVQTEAPTTRKVCHDVQGAYTRTPRRVCNIVEVKPRAAPAQALAAAPPPLPTTLEVGMPVVDAQGGAVGTITAIAADTVTVKTARHEAQLPKTSLALSEGKALFGMTQADLDASVERTLAARADPKVGAGVKGRDGASVGTIDAVATDNVTIRLADGLRISIPRSGMTVDADGGGTIGLTAAELAAQVKAAQPSR